MRPFLLALALIAAPATVRAGVPDPANSQVDPCLVVCPAGEIPFLVVVRDFNNAPIANSTVVIDFCGCPGVTLCPLSTTDPYQRSGPCGIRQVTDANGRVEFKVRAGGGCASPNVRVFADGVFLRAVTVASPDQDGSLMVLPPDLSLASSKHGSHDPTADFNCDGIVSDSDLAFVVAHAGHVCPPVDPTPTNTNTWGQLKLLYR